MYHSKLAIIFLQNLKDILHCSGLSHFFREASYCYYYFEGNIFFPLIVLRFLFAFVFQQFCFDVPKVWMWFSSYLSCLGISAFLKHVAWCFSFSFWKILSHLFRYCFCFIFSLLPFWYSNYTYLCLFPVFHVSLSLLQSVFPIDL